MEYKLILFKIEKLRGSYLKMIFRDIKIYIKKLFKRVESVVFWERRSKGIVGIRGFYF